MENYKAPKDNTEETLDDLRYCDALLETIQKTIHERNN